MNQQNKDGDAAGLHTRERGFRDYFEHHGATTKFQVRSWKLEILPHYE